MTTPILLTLIILAISVVLFVTERISMDLVGLLVLSVLALTGLVTSEQALSGFSSPAVVTVWAVFILSAGLARTGIAGWLGRLVIRFGGDSEIKTMSILMTASAFLSAFMNNIGVTAMLLPVVLNICRRTQRPPSRMLIPLAFSSLLGGMITQIGTPSNILVSGALVEFGYQPFQLFDFAPVGLVVTLAGILFLAVFGRLLLPRRDMAEEFHRGEHDMTEAFAIEERLFVVCLPENTPLAGKTLAQSHLGSVLNLNVIGILRDGHTRLAPSPEVNLQAGDRLLVTGRPDNLTSLGSGSHMVISGRNLSLNNLISDEVKIIEVGLTADSSLIGKTLEEVAFRQSYGGVVLALWREGAPLRTYFDEMPLQPDDLLLLQVSTRQLAELRINPDFQFTQAETSKSYRLHERLLLIDIPPGSSLNGSSLKDSRLGDGYGLGVMGIVRAGHTKLMPDADSVLQAGDTLLVKGKIEDIAVLRGLQDLEIDREAQPSYRDIESEQIGMVELVLSPQSTMPGQTLRQVNFREKYGLTVLAIWRGGTTRRSNLRDLPLRAGDALLVFGSRERLRLLAEDFEFLVLTEEIQAPPRLKKAPLAAGIMLAVVFSVALGWLSVAVAAVAGAAAMVLTGCLTMPEAYRAIEWRAIFLIAGLIPLGIAMQTSGAARLIAEQVITLTRPYGVYPLLGGIFALALLASQVMPNPVVTVLIAPIAITTAADLGYSPQAFLILIAVAASSSFLSPVGHPTNILIMGPGGYKFSDYIKVGLPLVIIIMAVTLLILPVFWPLTQ